jgi:type I restriction enzyme R subunit
MKNSPEYNYSELPAIQLLEQLGYQYYDASQGVEERKDITEVILKDRLLTAITRLNPWMDEANIQKAFNQLTSVQGASLMEINQKIWELIRGGTSTLKQELDGDEIFKEVHYIDYENPENNDFLVVNQIKFHGKYQNSIPDLVIFVNGLPLVVIECKSPTAQNAWDKAYSDLEYYQENSEKLFHYNQICVGLWQLGGRYGAISAPQKFYSVYKPAKEDDLSVLGDKPYAQDVLIYSLFRKEVLLDIIRHFVIFELDEGRTIKKLPRYQQLRAANKTVARLQAGEGGVVWHTQGSGKSITMAYVTRKLQAEEFGFGNPTVIIMTDRKDLDLQITTTFRNVGFKNVHQASSVSHLNQLLGNDYGGIITTTLQKFQAPNPDKDEEDDQTALEEKGDIKVEKYVEGKELVIITKQLQKGKWKQIERRELELSELSNKKNLFVLVDEAHRSHYGFLASFMRTVLPNAKFIAFTGTPISKKDKSTLKEFYGGDYIDVYTIKESVADGATVELLYDEGIARMDIKKEELEEEFKARFGHESEEKQEKLKNEALTKYQFSRERVDTIAEHIIEHFKHKIFPDGHKAMIVCSGRYAALRYQKALVRLMEQGKHGFKSRVVMSIGSPKSDEIAKDYYKTLDWNKKNPDDQKPIWVVPPEEVKTVTDDFKLPFGDENITEKSGKKKYDNTAFLIVSDMLLTGYDAPVASCLYLDKPLKEHNLLQAIARVNRARKGKHAGFVVDYYGIGEFLVQALEIFSGDLSKDDILSDLTEEIPRLESHHTKLIDLFKPIKIDRKYERDDFLDEALRFIEPIDKRDEFKNFLKHFNKSLNIVLPNEKALRFQGDFKLFNELKLRARNAYPEDEELKVTKAESKMLQEMIDRHLKAEKIDNLLEEPISIIDHEKFKEELINASPSTKELKIRNNLKYTVKVGLDKNPDFYKPISEKLEELLKLREEKRISDTELLKAYAGLLEDIISEHEEGSAKGFNTERKRAVYNSMKVIFNGDVEDAEDATKTFFDLIKGELGIIGWEQKGRVLKDIENKVRRFLKMKLDKDEARTKAKELVDILLKNKDA